jgi:drug/metabolite transporter (DMT)-like permease
MRRDRIPILRTYARIMLWLASFGLLAVLVGAIWGISLRAIGAPATGALFGAGVAALPVGAWGYYKARRTISREQAALEMVSPVPAQAHEVPASSESEGPRSGRDAGQRARRWRLAAVMNSVAGVVVVVAAGVYVRWPWSGAIAVGMVIAATDSWYLARRSRGPRADPPVKESGGSA